MHIFWSLTRSRVVTHIFWFLALSRVLMHIFLFLHLFSILRRIYSGCTPCTLIPLSPVSQLEPVFSPTSILLAFPSTHSPPAPSPSAFQPLLSTLSPTPLFSTYQQHPCLSSTRQRPSHLLPLSCLSSFPPTSSVSLFVPATSPRAYIPVAFFSPYLHTQLYFTRVLQSSRSPSWTAPTLTHK